jgi:hypothetical protein
MFPFTQPLGPNFSHLYLAAYIYVFAAVEPVLENLEKLSPRRPNTTNENKPLQASQKTLKKEIMDNASPSNVIFEDMEDDFLVIEKQTGDGKCVHWWRFGSNRRGSCCLLSNDPKKIIPLHDSLMTISPQHS